MAILPIQPGEICGRLKALDVRDSEDETILAQCLVCRRQFRVQRWKFRRPLQGRERACDDCNRSHAHEDKATLTTRMWEALSYVGERSVPLSSLLTYCGKRTLEALVRLGAIHKDPSGVVVCSGIGLAILSLTPRWSLTQNAKGEPVGLWPIRIHADGTVTPFATKNPQPTRRKALTDKGPVVLENLGGWLEPTTEPERHMLWEQLQAWAPSNPFPTIHPRLLARLLRDVDRLSTVAKEFDRFKAQLGETPDGHIR